MRKAIIVELKKITDFNDRVYQAFAAPTTVVKPYCTVKLTGENPTPGNKYGSPIDFQIYIYNTPGSFVSLDDLEMKVRKQLHNVMLSTDESPARHFTIYYVRTLADYFDDVANLFQKIIYFNIPLSRM